MEAFAIENGTTTVPSVSDVLVQRIIRLRRLREMTRESIAASCVRIGHPEMTATTIANIETGLRNAKGRRRRDVTVDELTAFAQVFDVSVAELLGMEACSVCHGRPPAGMSCNACGAGAGSADMPAPPESRQVRRVLSESLLVEVAEVYRAACAAGFPPLNRIAESFGVSHSAAGRWVREARKAGILGPALGTVAGEVKIA